MNALWLGLILAFGVSAPGWSADPLGHTASGTAVFRRDRSLLLSAVRDWREYVARTPQEVQAGYLPELCALQADVLAARSAGELAFAGRRWEAWKKALLAELFPASDPAPDSGRVAVEKLGGSIFSEESRKTLSAASARIARGLDGGITHRFFDASFSGREDRAVLAVAPRPRRPQALRAEPILGGPDADAGYRFGAVAAALRRRGASRRIVDMTIKEARRQRVDPLLVLAVMKTESGFNAHATSRVGAIGLLQVMPGTAQGLGIADSSALYDPRTNIRAGIRYLKILWKRFAGFSFADLSGADPFFNPEVQRVVAAYNAGPGAVIRHGVIPPYRETQRFVTKVLRTYLELLHVFRGAGAAPRPAVLGLRT